MKRFLAMILVLITVISFAACSSSSSSKSSSGEKAAETVATPGSSVKNSKYEFNFEKAKAYNEIKGDNEYLVDTPEKGKEYVVCFFEVKNISDENNYVNPLYLKGYVDDEKVSESLLINDVDGYKMLSGDLEPGKKMKGCIAYELPNGWKKLELSYTDGITKSSDTYRFEVTPDSLSK